MSIVMGKLIHIGKARRPHGVKGELGVEWSNNDCPLSEGSYLTFKLQSTELKFKLEKIRQGTKKTIIKLDGINDRTKAAELTNAKIFADESDLKKLNENQYYVNQIVGLKVLDKDGNNFGKITSVYPTGSNDVYEIEHLGKSFLIPAISSVIKEINIDNGFIKIEVIEGLFEEE